MKLAGAGIIGNAEELDAIYANCLFDLCDPREVSVVVDEIWRAMRPGGHLYSVYMGVPSHPAARAWAWLFRRLPTLSHGFHPVRVSPSLLARGFSVVQNRAPERLHPVRVSPSLLARGFSVVQNRAPERLGFPLRYVEAEKPKGWVVGCRSKSSNNEG
jgi:SAM-dependent methyltransferase